MYHLKQQNFFFSNLFSSNDLNFVNFVLSQKNFFLTLLRVSISSEVALPLFKKKLLCFDEILAPPITKSEQFESLMSFHAFLFSGFLNVLPQFLTLLGWLSFFLFIKLILFFSISYFFSILPCSVTLIQLNLYLNYYLYR